MIHITSNNDSSHLHCLQCWCNPVEVTVEGETYILHNSNYLEYERGSTEVQRTVQESGNTEEDI